MATPKRVNNFKEDLAWSQAQAGLPLWEEVYRRAFPDFDHMTLVHKDGWAQRGGIDRMITTTSGNLWMIDEKCRRKYYEVRPAFKARYYKPNAKFFPDIFLEFIDHEKRGTPGWIEKELACHYIAYNILPLCQCYLLPVAQTQRAWQQNKVKWLTEFGKRSSPNPGYNTIGCPVPVPVLMRAVCEAMFFRHEWLDEYEQYIEHDNGEVIDPKSLPLHLDVLFEL